MVPDCIGTIPERTPPGATGGLHCLGNRPRNGGSREPLGSPVVYVSAPANCGWEGPGPCGDQQRTERNGGEAPLRWQKCEMCESSGEMWQVCEREERAKLKTTRGDKAPRASHITYETESIHTGTPQCGSAARAFRDGDVLPLHERTRTSPAPDTRPMRATSSGLPVRASAGRTRLPRWWWW